MTNQVNPQNMWGKNNHHSFRSPIIANSIPILIEQRKETELNQEKTPDLKPKPKKIIIAKYELSNNIVKFFSTKGVFKKRWVILKEIPVLEITNIECLGRELILNWKSDTYSFIFKQKSGSFDNLRDQILSLLKEQQKTNENREDNNQKQNELMEIINTAIDVIDSSFDILIGLHKKRVNWTHLETCAESLGSSLTFGGQTTALLNLNFEKVSVAIRNQDSKEIAKEVFSRLKKIYEYFNGLKPDADLNRNGLNFENAKWMILSYYMLNDLLLGKVVGDKNDKKEQEAFESILLGLTNEETNKIDTGVLYSTMDKLEVEAESESVIEEVRVIFREGLLHHKKSSLGKDNIES